MFQVRDRIFEAGFQCDVDTDTSDTLNKKIRNAQLDQYNYILGTLCALERLLEFFVPFLTVYFRLQWSATKRRARTA